jgi:hypothetical protein
MVVIVLVAVDFAIVGGMQNSQIDIGIAFATLPMANILILVAPGAWGGSATRRFWLGFEVAGWLMTVLFVYLSYSHAAAFFRPANSVYPWNTIKPAYLRHTYLIILDLIVYTPPQILIAWFVGWVLAKSQSRLEPNPSDGPR